MTECNNHLQYQKSVWRLLVYLQLSEPCRTFPPEEGWSQLFQAQSYTIFPSVLKTSSNWETILRLEWVRSDMTKNTWLNISSKGKIQPLLLSESSDNRKGFNGNCKPRRTFPTLDRFGQIWNVLFLLLKTFFHSWPSKTQSSKLHYYFFMQEQTDHNTIRKRRESVCLALCFFVVIFGK